MSHKTNPPRTYRAASANSYNLGDVISPTPRGFNPGAAGSITITGLDGQSATRYFNANVDVIGEFTSITAVSGVTLSQITLLF